MRKLATGALAILAISFLASCALTHPRPIAAPSAPALGAIPLKDRDPLSLRTDDLVSTRTTRAERELFLQKMRVDVIQERFSRPPSKQTEEDWEGAFWAAQLIQDCSDCVRSALAKSLAQSPGGWPDCSDGFRRAALQCVHSLFPLEFRAEIERLLGSIKHPKLYAMAAYYLEGAALDAADRKALEDKILRGLAENFPGDSDNPILEALRHRIEVNPAAELASRPPLRDLLAYSAAPGRPVVFSLQRHDRRHPGLAIVRRPGGFFARNTDGSVFAVPQLALSISNLPGTITNGNTPQGIFSIRGIDYTANAYIGPAPFLWSRLPFEAAPADFLHNSDLPATATWSREMYSSLLPPSWRGYFPIGEAFLAGKAGRSEIIVHGTTINPEFYRGAPYYPMTPSLGCLCAREIWAPETGRAAVSDQLALVQAYLGGGEPNGFLVVVELDSQAAPVALDEVLGDILSAESAQN